MPSPFPGMDPFLEDPEVFPDLHNDLIFCLKQMLRARLPEPYYASSGSRAWVEIAQRSIWPDVNVLRSNGGVPAASESSGGAVVATAISMPVVVHVPQDERRETFLNIYTRQDGGPRLVSSIEVLSPSNKTRGAQARTLYLQKQQEILGSNVHLVEIDLLRGGEHTTAVPRDIALRKTGPFDYHVCVHPFDRPFDFLVYPIQLANPLPQIAIPLLPDVAAVAIELQSVFDQSYDAGPYFRSIRYAERKLSPAFRFEQEEWVKQLLREKGLLPPEAASAV